MKTKENTGFKETEIGLIPEHWEVERFENLIEKKRIKVGKVKQKDYKKVGKYPIIDQGQKLIAGYWDNKEDVYKEKLPVIIFGDHTRIFKYINFPFVLGADGAKVIIPNVNLVEPKYFYFALKSLKIPSRGYNRHFSLLKEFKIPLPPLPEQKAIASVLDSVRQAIEKTEEVITATKELKKSLMKHLFTYGVVPLDEIDKVKLKETEIGLIPEHWEVVRLENYCYIVRGSSPRPKGNPKYFSTTHTSINWIKISDLSKYKKGKYIVNTDEYLTEEGKKKSRYLTKGTLVLTNSGTVGIPAILGISGCIHDGYLAFLKMEDGKLGKEFLYYTFEYSRKRLINMAPKGTQANLNTRLLKQFKIPLPSIDEQKQIAEILSKIDQKIEAEENKKEALEKLFKTLLNELMTGKRRIKKEFIKKFEE